MKKIIALITVCILCLTFALPVFASSSNGQSLLNDDAGVLTKSERKEVKSYLEDASKATGMDVVVAFVNEQANSDIQDSADLYYEDKGYGSGIIMFVNVDERNYIFSTSGEAIECFTQSDFDDMTDEVNDYLRNDDWAGAAEEYAQQAQYYIEYKQENGHTYGEEQAEHSGGLMAFIWAVVIGGVVSTSVVGAMKKKHKTVESKASASDYYDPKDLVVTAQSERFLFRNVVKIPIPKNDSKGGGYGGHFSSSGGFHGGGGGGHF